MTSLPVRLEPLTRVNRAAIEALRVTETQRRYLTTPDLAPFLAEAPAHPTFTSFAVVADGRVAGFVSIGHLPGDETQAWIPLLVVDREQQGRGIGRAAMGIVLENLGAQEHCVSVGLTCHAENASALALYESLGFARTGIIDGQEVELRRPLVGSPVIRTRRPRATPRTRRR